MSTDLQRWSREVAEDPGSPSFVLLARAYRRQGRREAARSVVLGGLRANPEHVDGHSLLALLHIEAGDRESARDEWETALRLDPGNFDASRGLGFLALERGDLSAARVHLDTALRARPEDPAVQQARDVLARREAAAKAPDPTVPAEVTPSDPVDLFAPLAGQAPFLGAVLLDDRGLPLAGRVEGDRSRAELLGGLFSASVGEASRTARILGLGQWEGMLLETELATLHVDAVEGGAVVVVTRPNAPAGWVARVAGQARELAVEFLREVQ